MRAATRESNPVNDLHVILLLRARLKKWGVNHFPDSRYRDSESFSTTSFRASTREHSSQRFWSGAISLLWNVSALGQQPTPILPDPKLTPGDVFNVTLHDICTLGYSKKVRAVPARLRKQAYALYGITSHTSGDYQLDHLIPLSLGGSNSIRNVWPQSYRTSPCNAHVKDVLGRRLYTLVCAGKVDLETARHGIATEWIQAYQK